MTKLDDLKASILSEKERLEVLGIDGDWQSEIAHQTKLLTLVTALECAIKGLVIISEFPNVTFPLKSGVADEYGNYRRDTVHFKPCALAGEAIEEIRKLLDE